MRLKELNIFFYLKRKLSVDLIPVSNSHGEKANVLRGLTAEKGTAGTNGWNLKPKPNKRGAGPLESLMNYKGKEAMDSPSLKSFQQRPG